MRHRLRNALPLLAVAAVIAWLVVRSWSDPVSFSPKGLAPLASGPRTLKVVSFNVAHCRGVGLNQIFTGNGTLEQNLEALSEYLRWEQADLVVLQEIDESHLWSGRLDQVERLAMRAGYPYWMIGPNNGLGPLPLRYGNALLSRHRIIGFRNTAFGGMSIVGGKGFFEARISMGKLRFITVLGAHLHHASAEAREDQAGQMAKRIKRIKEPLLVLGDLNVDPRSKERTLPTLLAGGKLSGWRLDRPAQRTFPAQAPTRRIDYVFASRHLDFVAQRARKLAWQ